MELRDLKTFLAVARRLSFHRAAVEVHAAQSTVSARIAALEDDLGVRLFERLGRTVRLTPAGERLRDHAAKMLDLEDEARAWVAGAGEARGSLTVRVPESLCAWRMGGIIREFRERFPLVHLCLMACTHDALEQDLRQGVRDLAFLLYDGINARDLVVEVLGVERLVLRRNERLDVTLPSTIHGAFGDHEVVLLDLAPTGCSFAARSSLKDPLRMAQPGERLILNCDLGSGNTFTVPLTLRRVDEHKGRITMGGQFVDMSEESARLLNDYLQRMQGLLG